MHIAKSELKRSGGQNILNPKRDYNFSLTDGPLNLSPHLRGFVCVLGKDQDKNDATRNGFDAYGQFVAVRLGL